MLWNAKWILKELKRRTFFDPLAKVPELRVQIARGARFRHGVEAVHNGEVAKALLLAVEYAVGAAVEGEIAEFGCMTGRTARVIAGAMAAFDSDKVLHLFDSFEGLPVTENRADLDSPHVKTGVWGPGTCKGITPRQLYERVTRFIRADQVKIHQGWFSKTLPHLPLETRFALLHVDCDLYQSSIDVLDFVGSPGTELEFAL